MESRNNKRKMVKKRPVSFEAILDKDPDYTFYAKDTVKKLNQLLISSAKELYRSLSLAFSLDQMSFVNFKSLIWPVITSSAAFIIGEYLTAKMSEAYTDTDEYDFVFKFMLGSAILGYCAVNRITEKRLTSRAEISVAIAMEVLAITYLHTSTYTGTRMLLQDSLSDNYSLIASLGASGLVVPGGVSYLTKKFQETMVRRLCAQGAQRSDTAIIPSGLTAISSTYFLAGRFIVNEEMSTPSRLFQLGMISDNIFNATKALRRYRNLPLLFADIGPATIKKILAQREKIEFDYHYNTTTEQVLIFTENGPELMNVPRYQLKNGDLVYCGNNFDTSSVTVSGEIIALKRDDKGQFTLTLEKKRGSVNLRAHNGEDKWIEFDSKEFFTSQFKYVSLHDIHSGQQAGVLVGDKLNLYGGDNFFIQIKSEWGGKPRVSDYQKTSVLNKMITDRKRQHVLYAILSSVMMAGLLSKDIKDIPAYSMRLLFNLFHMMIQFSESILREMVNSRLMKELNVNQGDSPIETIDALRLVDLCNALCGYYHSEFPQGVAIVSDKTGTLTTSDMNVLGMWTTSMRVDVQNALKEEVTLRPDKETLMTCFEVFVSAYTNESKELEPEEFSILEQFKLWQDNQDCLNVTIEGNNHFVKKLIWHQDEKCIETFHLGLYRSCGGRFTLTDDGKQTYLIFCGVPKNEAFADTPLLKAYQSMQTRVGVLSRDWCIARANLSQEDFIQLKKWFFDDDKKQIETMILSHPSLLKDLQHHCTFIIDNPVKKGAEHFIAHYRDIHVPVFIATGDNVKAAANIAKVLCSDNIEKIITLSPESLEQIDMAALVQDETLAHSTLIFSGINDQMLSMFKQFLNIDKDYRPTIIFAEMSTEGKGLLAKFLIDNHFFVVANGDGTNDVMMMKHAHVVFSHLTDDGRHAPGVGQLSNLSDKQLKQLLGVDASFYELFDLDNPNSLLKKELARLRNSQIKPIVALTMKASKAGFELPNSTELYMLSEMPHQHWYNVAFDSIWFLGALFSINASADLPVENQGFSSSTLLNKCLIGSALIASVQAFIAYTLMDQTTDATTMVIMIGLFLLTLNSLFSSYGAVRDELYPDDTEPEPTRPGLFGFFNKHHFKQLQGKVVEEEHYHVLKIQAAS